MRLAKHLAHAGVASRRAAEALIADGRVSVDGQVVTDPARDVSGEQAITVDGRPVGARERERAVYAVNKPAGVVSTARDTHGRPTVVDLVRDAGRRLYPVGRLDADTTGLLLLTDDGDLAHRLTHPRFEVPKIYRARVRGGAVSARALRELREGVELDDGRTAPARVRQVGPGELELTLREGRKRQVRRMCAAVGHPVESLERIAFGPLRLGDLREGGVRRLPPAEVERLRAAADGPRGTSAPPNRSGPPNRSAPPNRHRARRSR
jgi:23S rRNA pseudouridine2605 synthase